MDSSCDIPQLQPGEFNLNLAGLQDGSMGMPNPYCPAPLDFGGMSGMPHVAEGSRDTGKLSKTAVISALEAVKQRVAELERKNTVYEQQIMEVVAHQLNIAIYNTQQFCDKQITDMKQYFEVKLAEALQKKEDDGDDDSDDNDGDDDEARMEASLEAKSDPGLLVSTNADINNIIGVDHFNRSQ
jgi:hypothetical protein